MQVKLKRRVMPESPHLYVYAERVGPDEWKMIAPGDDEDGRICPASQVHKHFSVVGSDGLAFRQWLAELAEELEPGEPPPVAPDEIPPDLPPAVLAILLPVLIGQAPAAPPPGPAADGPVGPPQAEPAPTPTPSSQGSRRRKTT